MKQRKSKEKIIAILLIVATVLPLFSNISNATEQNTQEYIFVEDFEDDNAALVTTGWTGTTNFALENGKLVGKTLNQAYSYLSGHGDWSNYTVEAEVSISETGTTNTSTASGKLAGIHVAAPGNSNGSAAGYEFMICRNASGSSMYCALKDRTGGSNGSDNIPLTIEWEKTYRLKVALSGNVILCYVDDQLMITKEISSVQTLSGTIGLHYSGGKVTTFDKVYVSATKQEEENDGCLFEEYFEDDNAALVTTGWTGTANFTLENGKLVGKTLNQAYSYLSGHGDWSNYTVEAEVSISETGTTNTSTASGKLAGIHVAAPGNSSGSAAGYEFMICRNASGSSMYCALKDRTGGSNGSDNIPLTIEWDKTYRLKVALSGNVIQCYVDDQLMITKEISSVQTLSGTIGLHYSGGKVTTFDNIYVTTTQVESGCIFEEYFEDDNAALVTTGWTGTANFTLENGKLVGKTLNQAYSYLSGHGDWSNYTVEAEVSISETGTTNTSTASGKLAGIHVAAPGNSSGSAAGYEFMICRNASGSSMYCALKDRTGGSNGSDNIPLTIEWDKTYRLKVALSGNVIRCYVDDELMITKEISSVQTLSGTIGLHYSGGKVTTFDNIYVTTTQVESGYMFEEYFEDDNNALVTTGWDIGASVTLENGQLLIDNNKTMYLSKHAGAANWSDYTYEADVTMTDTVTNTANSKLAAIVAGVNSSKQGYEFSLVYTKASNSYTCWLRDYTNSDKPIFAQPECDFELNETAHLKMVISGNLIKCYVNDILMISEIVATETVTGTIGVRANGYAVIFDNLLVSETVETEEEEPTPDDDDSEILEGNYLFQEYFSKTNSTLVNTGWDIGARVTLEEEQCIIKNNQSMYLSGYEGAADWSNYTYEADVVLTDTFTSAATTKMAAIIAGANSKKVGYEFALTWVETTDTYSCWLRDYTGDEKVMLARKNITFGLNEKVNLKMVLRDNTITCYLNNVLMFSKTAATDTIIGTIGVRANGYAGIFDNILVYPSEELVIVDPIPDVRGKDIWFYDNFAGLDAPTDRGWTEDFDIVDGRYVLTNDNDVYTYLTGIENCDKWDNYTVEADVMMSDDLTEPVTVGKATANICVRSSGPDDGYEFGITKYTVSGTGGVWLRIRNSKTLLMEDTMTIDRGTAYRLKMTVNKNQIDCYVDDELVFSYVDEQNVNPTGTIGLRKTGYTAYYDNVMVYQSLDKSLTSPQTGDNNMLCLFVIPIIGTIFSFYYWYSNKKRRNFVL